MRHLTRFALLLAALTAALSLAAPRAEAAWRAPCVPGTQGPSCTWWDAKTWFVADGDTIRVRVEGRNATIRFTGINAMELHRYSKYASRRRGDCHGVEATAIVDNLIKRAHGRVRLAAQRASSVTGGRLRRSVWVRSGGQWVDISRVEMEAGLALWLPNPTEWAHNADYHALAEQAALAQRGLYAPAGCGVGPDPDVPLKVDVNWDADGADGGNVNGEWVQVRNLGARPVSLRGWWVRDSQLLHSPRAPHRPGYQFPDWAVLAANGGAIKVHVGCGSDSATDVYWCQRRPIFENVSHDGRSMGDGAYLFDPRGNIRGLQIYPCLVGCTDPLQGKVRISAHASTPEAIYLRNVSGDALDLTDHIVKLHLHSRPDQFIFGYRLPIGSVLYPGETLTIFPDGGPSSRLVRHLNRGQYVLADGGNAVSLRDSRDMEIDCFAWGDGRC